MKLRDTLNTKEGYREIIEEDKEFIQKQLDDIIEIKRDESNGVQKYPKPNKEIIKSSIKAIFKYSYSTIKANYSLGNDIIIIKQKYLKLIHYFEESWQSDWGYVQMVEMLSLAILLDIEDTEFDKLVALVERDKLKDFVTDFLIRYRKPNWQQTEKFLWPKPYKIIKDIVTVSENDKQKALEPLKKYLKAWYKDLEVKTHESKWNIHTGYWSWEAGAIAKILELDDSSLKDQPYYPYDMVHFKDD